MTHGQLALMRALFTAGLIILALGIVIAVIGANSTHEVCGVGPYSGQPVCGEKPGSPMLGVVIAIFGLIVTVVTMVAWSALPPLAKDSSGKKTA